MKVTLNRISVALVDLSINSNNIHFMSTSLLNLDDTPFEKFESMIIGQFSKSKKLYEENKEFMKEII